MDMKEYAKKKIRKRVKKILFGATGVTVASFLLITIGLVNSIFAQFQDVQLTDLEIEGNKGLSVTVLSFRPLVIEYCKIWEMEGYESLILAMIQQESNGTGIDVMQCEESGLGVINTQEDSINYGIQYLSMHFKTVGVESPEDMDKIKLCLQAYNYGGAFIDFVNENGGVYNSFLAKQYQLIRIQQIIENLVSEGYTEEEATSMAGYGDSDYVAHVLQYYRIGGDSENVGGGADMNSPYYHIGVNIFSDAGYTGQCTWYVWGRANEVNDGAYPGYVLPSGNASEWFDVAMIRNFDGGIVPRSNSIMVWGDVYEGYGHVAYVEDYDPVTETIRFTDGNTGNPAGDGIFFENHNYTDDVATAFAYVKSHSMPSLQAYNYPGNGYFLIGYIYL